MTIYYEDAAIRVMQPKVFLAQDAIALECKQEPPSFAAIYRIYQNFKSYSADAVGRYYLERNGMRQIIPYPKSAIRFLVALNLLVTPWFSIGSKKPIGDEDRLKRALAQNLVDAPEVSSQAAGCPFCNKDQIDKQKIQESENILLLYNFKPISSRDFLIVAKPHIRDFNEPIFVEMMSLAKKICDVYAAKGYKALYVKFADTKAAGRTVDHLHIQVTVGKDWKEEVSAILHVMRKIVFDSWAGLFCPSFFRLSDRQLQQKIVEAKNDIGIDRG